MKSRKPGGIARLESFQNVSRETFSSCSGQNLTSRKPPLSPNVGGSLLDYEVQDGRTALQTKNSLIAWASMVHGAGRKAFLYANPLDAPTQALTGISSKDGPEILAAFDLISILL